LTPSPEQGGATANPDTPAKSTGIDAGSNAANKTGTDAATDAQADTGTANTGLNSSSHNL
jgi:hypothetical protein